MIIINLGFPKTSTTNLQINFYPYLNDINYFGKHYKNNSKLFIDLNNFIENRKGFSNSELNNLIQNLKNYCNKKKKILISQENWTGSFQKNNLTRKMEVVNQEVKLKNLLFVLNKINTSYKFFIIQRDLKTSISSLFVTLQDHIRLLYGEKFLSFDFFLDYINKKKNGYKDLLLLLDTYNLKKITKIIPENKIQLFDYKDILDNQKKFINNFSNYLGIEINDDLINKLSIHTKVTSINKKGEYQFESKNKLFTLLKLFIPKILINKLSFLLKIKFIRFFLFKNYSVNKKNDILEKIINEHF